MICDKCSTKCASCGKHIPANHENPVCSKCEDEFDATDETGEEECTVCGKEVTLEREEERELKKELLDRVKQELGRRAITRSEAKEFNTYIENHAALKAEKFLDRQRKMRGNPLRDDDPRNLYPKEDPFREPLGYEDNQERLKSELKRKVSSELNRQAITRDEAGEYYQYIREHDAKDAEDYLDSQRKMRGNPTVPTALRLKCGCGDITMTSKSGKCDDCGARHVPIYGQNCFVCWKSMAVDPQGHGQVCDGDWSKAGVMPVVSNPTNESSRIDRDVVRAYGPAPANMDGGLDIPLKNFPPDVLVIVKEAIGRRAAGRVVRGILLTGREDIAKIANALRAIKPRDNPSACNYMHFEDAFVGSRHIIDKYDQKHRAALAKYAVAWLDFVYNNGVRPSNSTDKVLNHHEATLRFELSFFPFPARKEAVCRQCNKKISVGDCVLLMWTGVGYVNEDESDDETSLVHDGACRETMKKRQAVVGKKSRKRQTAAIKYDEKSYRKRDNPSWHSGFAGDRGWVMRCKMCQRQDKVSYFDEEEDRKQYFFDSDMKCKKCGGKVDNVDMYGNWPQSGYIESTGD